MKSSAEASGVESVMTRRWRARLLSAILKPLIVLCALYEALALIPGFSDKPLLGSLIVAGLLVVMVVCLVLLQKDRVELAVHLFLSVVLATGIAGVVGYGGLISSLWIVFVMALLLAGLLSGWRSVLVYCGLGCLVLVLLLIDHFTGVAGFPVHPQKEIPSVLVIFFCLVIGAILMAHALRRLDEARQQRAAFERERTKANRLEAVGKLAGGVAHDFNNLLTAILVNCEFLSGQADIPEESRQRVRQIDEAGHRAAELTQQLLAFARRQVREPKVVDLNAVLTDLQGLLRRLIREDVELSVHTQQDLPTVRVDTVQLEQVVVNLAVNARDAMPDGGRLTIETAAAVLDAEYCDRSPGIDPGRYAVLSVSDTGQGMSAETMDHIFEPFYSTKDRLGGTGLGLATVYGIVRQSGGHIRVYSEPGRGATFKVYLPAVEQPAEAREQKGVSGQVPMGTGQLVVAVDDEPMVRGMVAEILVRFGYRALAFSSGQEALDAMAGDAETPALLITDVIMPRMGGRELASKLQSRFPDLRVLYVSGYTENAIVHRGELDAGVQFLVKPFTPTRLAKKIAELLDPSAPGEA